MSAKGIEQLTCGVGIIGESWGARLLFSRARRLSERPAWEVSGSMSEPASRGERPNNEFPTLTIPPQTVYVGGGSGVPPVGNITVPLPGSKYYTLRFLINATLADGVSVVRHPAMSEDTAVLCRALTSLGAQVTWARDGNEWIAQVHGCGGQVKPPPDGELAMGNAGAALRLLLGIGALLPRVRYTTNHPGSLGMRPNADLLDALRSLGVRAEAHEPGGRLPITLSGGPPAGGEVEVSGARSSQYLSALLYLGPLLTRGLTVTVRDELRSAPLVAATLYALRLAGIQIESAPDLRHFVVPGEQAYIAREYHVPGDGPSAAALIAAALAMRTPLRLERLDAGGRDVAAMLAAVSSLASVGVSYSVSSGAVDIRGNGTVSGATVDGDACIDSVPVLVALACCAEGASRFERVATLRLKESDRIADLCEELRRAGCDAEPGEDTILVRGRPGGIRGGVTVSAHDDHRLAQALAIVALRSERGLTIEGADAVAKSYPSFFDDLRQLGADVRPI